MRFKESPEEFFVKEITDTSVFEEKDEGRPFFYFVLKKRNYNQIRVLNLLSQKLNVSRKRIHFAGTKDKYAVTEQMISVNGVSKDEIFERVEFINEKVKDVELEYVGEYWGRINLGDSKGNLFHIIVRELTDMDLKTAEKKIKHVETEGVINYFDDQRFGYAGNSHLVGYYVVKNDIKEALREIFTSMPANPSEEIKFFVENFPSDFDSEGVKWCVKNLPRNMRDLQVVLEHLIKFPNDFPGAFRRLHKKLRTLYVNALQSWIWNKVAERITEKTSENMEVPLVGYNSELDGFEYKDIVEEVMNEVGVSGEEFFIRHMPELSIEGSYRELRIYPWDVKLSSVEDDEVYGGYYKAVLEFCLKPGAYATNIVKQIFK